MDRQHFKVARSWQAPPRPTAQTWGRANRDTVCRDSEFRTDSKCSRREHSKGNSFEHGYDGPGKQARHCAGNASTERRRSDSFSGFHFRSRLVCLANAWRISHTFVSEGRGIRITVDYTARRRARLGRQPAISLHHLSAGDRRRSAARFARPRNLCLRGRATDGRGAGSRGGSSRRLLSTVSLRRRHNVGSRTFVSRNLRLTSPSCDCPGHRARMGVCAYSNDRLSSLRREGEAGSRGVQTLRSNSG